MASTVMSAHVKQIARGIKIEYLRVVSVFDLVNFKVKTTMQSNRSFSFFEPVSIFCPLSRPLMIVTQKITTLAFQIHDGEKIVFPLDLRAMQVSSTPHACISHTQSKLYVSTGRPLSLLFSFQTSIVTPFYFPSPHSPFLY